MDWQTMSSRGLFKSMNFSKKIEEQTRRRRRGYILGSHAYDAGVSINSLPDTVMYEEEEDGWMMGWNSRYAAEMAGLEPSQHGVLESALPYDWPIEEEEE